MSSGFVLCQVKLNLFTLICEQKQGKYVRLPFLYTAIQLTVKLPLLSYIYQLTLTSWSGK